MPIARDANHRASEGLGSVKSTHLSITVAGIVVSQSITPEPSISQGSLSVCFAKWAHLVAIIYHIPLCNGSNEPHYDSIFGRVGATMFRPKLRVRVKPYLGANEWCASRVTLLKRRATRHIATFCAGKPYSGCASGLWALGLTLLSFRLSTSRSVKRQNRHTVTEGQAGTSVVRKIEALLTRFGTVELISIRLSITTRDCIFRIKRRLLKFNSIQGFASFRFLVSLLVVLFVLLP